MGFRNLNTVPSWYSLTAVKFPNASFLCSSPQRCAHALCVGCEHGIEADLGPARLCPTRLWPAARVQPFRLGSCLGHRPGREELSPGTRLLGAKIACMATDSDLGILAVVLSPQAHRAGQRMCSTGERPLTPAHNENNMAAQAVILHCPVGWRWSPEQGQDVLGGSYSTRLDTPAGERRSCTH